MGVGLFAPCSACDAQRYTEVTTDSFPTSRTVRISKLEGESYSEQKIRKKRNKISLRRGWVPMHDGAAGGYDTSSMTGYRTSLTAIPSGKSEQTTDSEAYIQ